MGRLQKSLPVRRLAVIEQPSPFTIQPEQQLIMATPSELEEYRRQFPNLVARWAEVEDKKKWRFSESMFDRKEGALL